VLHHHHHYHHHHHHHRHQQQPGSSVLSMFLWRIVQSTKPDVRCAFLPISKCHVPLHPTSSRGHHSLKFHETPSCVTNVITGWWGEGVAVALEPYTSNNVSLSFLFSMHSSGMLNCLRARASCGCLRVSTTVCWHSVQAKHTVFILFGQASSLFIFGEQTSQTVEKTGVGQEREASHFWSVGSVHSFVRSFVRSCVPTLGTAHLSDLLLGLLERRRV
jgi:hypothetical protein